MLLHGAGVFVLAIVGLRQVAEDVDHVAIGNQRAAVERLQRLRVGDEFTIETARVFELVRVLRQLLPNASLPTSKMKRRNLRSFDEIARTTASPPPVFGQALGWR